MSSKKPPSRSKLWHNEATSADEAHSHAYKQVLAEGTTKFQEFKVVDYLQLGKGLILDGKIQSAARDEFIYHESLVHPAALLLQREMRRVLVIGGGEGATLREVLRYPHVERAVMVDIDRQVVEACQQHLQEFHQGAFEDARTQLVIDDARHYVEQCQERFDLAIIDITEALEGTTAAYMYTKEFYQQLGSLLEDHGVVVVQSGSLSITDSNFFRRLHATLHEAFANVWPFSAFVPSFATLWGFNLATKDRHQRLPEEAEVDGLLSKLGVASKLRFYDATTHSNMFKLPKYIRALLEKPLPIYTAEDKPAICSASAHTDATA